MKKSLLITVAVLVSCIVCNAQIKVDLDSLQRLLKVAKSDSVKVDLLLKIGEQYESTNPEKAKKYYKQVLYLSKKSNYIQGELKYASYYTAVLNMQGEFDASLIINLNALKLAKKINDPLAIAKAGFNVATTYTHLGKYDLALNYYFLVLPYIEEQKNERMLAVAYNNLQSVYRILHQYEKAINYGNKALQLIKTSKDSVTLTYTLSNLGTNYASLNKLDRALSFYNEAYVISNKLGDMYSGSTLLLNIGDIDYKQGNYEKAKEKFINSLSIAKQLNLYETQIIATKGIGSCLLQLKKIDEAKKFANAALNLSYQYENREQRLKIFNLLEDISYGSNDFNTAEKYSIKYDLLNDSINNDNLAEINARYEKEYQTAKKDAQIKEQEAKLKNRRLLNYVFAGAILATILIGFMSYKNLKNRQVIQQQKINELEKEKQLTATEAVLRGEEQERSRLAKDLHDGLGGMLSGVKLSFNAMKENLILTPENAKAFEKSIDQLDNSIREMRRVAHNMLPENLMKYGLNSALQELCAELNRSTSLKASYQSIDMTEKQFTQEISIASYRITQELVNNALKYSEAKNLLVQAHFSNSEKILHITVEDDGKGFDSSILSNSEGIGWKNIQNRIQLVKGKIDLNSVIGNGTSVVIEIPV